MSNPTASDLNAFADLPAAELRSRLERVSESDLDALPFGVIRLDPASQVVFYSQTEGRQSGHTTRYTIGKKFFTELAPCMGTPEFQQRVEQARAAGNLDITFEQVGDFADADRQLLVRMISSADAGVWILLQRKQ